MSARIPLVVAGALVAAALLWIAWPHDAEQRADPPRVGTPEPARYVGAAACASCHARETELWTGSDHDLAMQEATEETVLGDFSGVSYEHFGQTSTFLRRDGKFVVRTDGPDGQVADYEVAYTFGVRPLQQYLVAFPGGRYQALPLCWDARPAEAGGQRWFHLHPEERIPSFDLLHWTGPHQNWNYMCAECHSTNLRKGYALDEDRYETTWSDIDVACEACHGPGSQHVAWAEGREPGGEAGERGDTGLVLSLREPERVPWVMDPDTGVARRPKPRSDWSELETCARCHAHRGVLSAEYEHGRPLLDTHRPMLLTEDLYYADGQIREEVYEYGSFLQSRMHAQGVTCSDCHDPHSLRIAGSKDAVCARCHAPERFAAPSHHHHEPGSPGASCVECHMPARDYMVVDPRRDHSFRVPRPDLSLELGVPNACERCHAERGSEWAAAAVRAWYPEGRNTQPHFARALAAGRAGAPGAERALVDLARDATTANVVRASALELLANLISPRSIEAVADGLGDPDPLVRFGALAALRGVEPLARAPFALPLLRDPVRALRIDAAGLLAELPAQGIPDASRADFEAALAEYRAEHLANADRAGAHLMLALLHLARGERREAERCYRKGIALDPRAPALYANLADLYREENREEEGEALLRAGIEQVSSDGGLHYALGMLLVRRGRLVEALDSLERALSLQPEVARYALALGLALEAAGESERAMEVLRTALEQHPYDQDLLRALLERARQEGDAAAALGYARRLEAVAPDDVAARALVRELERDER